MVVLTLVLLCLYTIGAGAAIARLLPTRLALLRVPQVATRTLARGDAALRGATGSPGAGAGRATAGGVSARLSGLIGSGNLGPRVGALVTDLSTGQVLYSFNATTGFTPASTTKLATAVAALHTLGPATTFTTSAWVTRSQRIVLVGGGDPTLAAGRYPSADYPQPATLSSLAAATARQLRARHMTSVRLGYDDALFGGPVLGLGWPAFGTANNYIMSGNVAPITGLEVDQGRLTARGRPEDSDDPLNLRPRSMTPGLDAAHAFARFLRKDGITVHGAPTRAAAPTGGTRLAAVHSPPLAEILQQMLAESNNVIAETVARQVAAATGRPGTFSGAAAAVMAVDRRLGVNGISLHDGSGLSPLDLITPAALVKLVRLAAQPGQARLRPALTGLPVAGFYGTLGPGSFFGPFGRPALGLVRAKTGNLTGVATMAGLAYAKNGQIIAFAFMGNGITKKLGLRPELTLAQLATVLAGCGCR
jgi:D-alanyl-D-alanine carboxypeptidase/D-alanyl-D-alanine-endopeptidase (penicillin-binding protein 4)